MLGVMVNKNVLRVGFEDSSLTTGTLFNHHAYIYVDNWKYVEEWWYDASYGGIRGAYWWINVGR